MRWLEKTIGWTTLLALTWAATIAPLHAAQTALADFPIGASGSMNVPANVLFTPSVEFPTAVSQAHLGAFNPGQTYIGYFDAYKCYDYDATANAGAGAFVPRSFTIGVTALAGRPVRTGSRFCSGRWSGNYLNWATMQTIDTFRMVLTGGDRTVDTATETIVRKAYASGQGGEANFEIKSLTTNIASLTPLPWAGVYVRIQGNANAMDIGANYANVRDTVLQPGELRYTVAVRVCVPDTDPTLGIPMLEDNCTPYYSDGVKQYYKPEGLIQRNADRMRYGVFAYLNDGNPLRDGGVLRSRMKFVGPSKTVPGAPPVSNPNREWDPATGVFYVNPDPTDAAASSVTASGVINYLNEFGNYSGSYKTYDNVSEMYYAALRYLRNAGPVTQHQDNVTAAMKDGYPVITNWEDPILYSCQKNFTVGIGDVNTHRDRNVPGGTNPFGGEPAMPAQVSADTPNLNLHTWTNSVGAVEGMGAIGDQNGGCCMASYYIAGQAYWAHTQDVRPDLPGTQTVDFYWVDVLEYQQYRHKNQYWLAAKYGGFSDDDGDGKPVVENEWRKTNNQLSWNGSVYKLPDNYFVASNPSAMADGLSRTFQSINREISRNAGLGASSASLTPTGGGGYLPSYEPKGWTGDVTATTVSSSNGVLSKTNRWSAQTKLETQAAGSGWQSRAIATSNGKNGGGFSGIPFRADTLSNEQLDALNADATMAAKLVDYLRGDRSNEGTLFRIRDKLLGSVVDSAPAVVGPPNQPYDEGANPGYIAFRGARTARPPIVLVGANDGMLHAFDGNLSSGGNEVWAYVPSELLDKPEGGATNGLVNYATIPYVHRYLVNGPVRVQDVDLANTKSGHQGSGDWRTIAIAGMGKGGRSYVAIDVTDTTAVNTVEGIAGKVLWEFSDDKMGYTFGSARVFKTRKWGWVAALPSGYNNKDGKGYVFIVDVANGKTLATLRADEGSKNDPLGLAHIGAYIPDLGDYAADSVYGGDLKGNVWRWDVGDAPGDVEDLDEGVYKKPVKIATLTAPDGTRQPVTTEPEIQSQPGTQDRYVFVGTGRFLDASDMILGQTQTFYALRDGRRWSPWQKAADMPAGVSWPFSRGSLQQVSTFTSGITPMVNKAGWYYDLTGGGGTGANERVAIHPVAFAGVVAFATYLPDGQTCSPGGSGRLYAVSFNKAKSQFTTEYVQTSSPIVKVSIVDTGDRLAILATFAGSQTATTGGGTNVSCSGELCQVDLKMLNPTAVNRFNVREIRADH